MMRSWGRWWGMWFVSLLLTAMPVPGFVAMIEPPWVLLCLLYTLLASEWQTVLVCTVISGWLLDTLQLMPLGSHVVALTVGLWMALLRIGRFNHYSLNQQSVLVAGICFSYALVMCLLEWKLIGEIQWFAWMRLVSSAFMGGICWPWIKVSLDRYMRLVMPRRQIRRS